MQFVDVLIHMLLLEFGSSPKWATVMLQTLNAVLQTHVFFSMIVEHLQDISTWWKFSSLEIYSRCSN